ncbi:ABC transporter ATP-binding protein [Umezakia ovalisporum]|uniref:ABC transporter ATP-binding protein n=1 Tax=Umezakia ovalisporum TaxID=75695 RepID=UPI002475410F|nr:polysaccharide ABC transporter ATP-binding protein [Umezakia ovalisporum]MBI1240954.1 ATP-binding cassette domain-containing protein [Nostoc sp. RI_552]MDH6088877.1 polysaccharide ABC transporter ATP-binding protein [Umezakia ovalisporum Ak1311]
MTVLTSHEDTFKQPQDDEVVLSVKNVSKRFCRDLKKSLFYGIQDIAGEVFGARRKDVELRKGEFWALNDVSFELRRGEALGLVGANGAGKTTMLRIISGLIKPDHGSVEIKGRVAPLIALGAGFNPILTGRENVYVNMSILGLSKEEIDERFEDVVEFAEIGEAIDAPVQSYSSGMAARLGFACAIHTEPDILLIDEVLSVGDIRFRGKCNTRLKKLQDQGTSVVMVSHSSQSILNVCRSAVYLLRGNLICQGDVSKVMSRYEQDLHGLIFQSSPTRFVRNSRLREGSTSLDIVSIFFRDFKNNIIDYPESGKFTSFCVACKIYKELQHVSLYVVINSAGGENEKILLLSSYNDKISFSAKPGNYEFRMKMPYIGLKPGQYYAQVVCKTGSLQVLDYVETFLFSVTSNQPCERNLYFQSREWELVENI